MLTVEQVKAHSEISVKVGGWSLPPGFLYTYKAKLSYLKDGKICRLSLVEEFPSYIPITKEELPKWNEDKVRSLIPADKWETFAHFVNESEIISEGMLLSWQEVRAYLENHKRNNLGTYKMLRYGKVEDIDVQANVRAIYDIAVEACKVF